MPATDSLDGERRSNAKGALSMRPSGLAGRFTILSEKEEDVQIDLGAVPIGLFLQHLDVRLHRIIGRLLVIDHRQIQLQSLVNPLDIGSPMPRSLTMCTRRESHIWHALSSRQA